MRNDNAADYPWLAFALATLIDDTPQAATRPLQRPPAGSLARPLAFVKTLPFASASPSTEERSNASRRSGRRMALYSPLSLFFNFSHNVVKGTARRRPAAWRCRDRQL